MSRQDLIDKLATYGECHPGERATIEQFLAFVHEHPDCFRRELKSGHITGSAWVVNRDGTKVLLLHHRKLDKWLQPGGHADGNPDVHSVAKRELIEETRLATFAPVGGGIFDLDIHPIPERPGEPAHLHYDVRFAFRATGPEALQSNAESYTVTWICLDAIHLYTNEASIRRMHAKWKAISQAT